MIILEPPPTTKDEAEGKGASDEVDKMGRDVNCGVYHQQESIRKCEEGVWGSSLTGAALGGTTLPDEDTVQPLGKPG